MPAQLPAFLPTEKSQASILEFYRQSYRVLNQQWNIREQLRQIDLSYMRETDLTEEQYKAKLANRRGDSTKFQNITLPIVMPQVEAAVTYQQSVFLTGYPIFGVVSHPEFADEALMMDTIIGEQQIRGGWVNELIKTMRDGFKYNIGACEVDWSREVTYSLETNLSKGDKGQAKEVIWEGNKLNHLDMYNTFWDTRCDPLEVPEWGEFAGYSFLASRTRLKQYLQALPTRINVKEAFESGYSAPVAFGATGVESYYMPQLNPEALYDLTTAATTDWMAWAGLHSNRANSIQYKNMYQITILYGRILPSDFGFKNVPGPNTPQVWKFVIVNNQVIVYAERMTNVHNLIPILFYVPLDDGRGYQTKSFAKNIEPIQEITTALANSSIAARRRAISDRMLFDPSRVSAAALNNDNPTAKIPVRPSAYQDDLSKAVYPFPFRDDQFQINNAEIQFYSALANQISGLNPARQGQFVKGNKTRTEFQEIMSYANGRDQAIAMSTEGSFFTPLKEIIKTNILQYQGGVSLYNREAQVSVNIDPVLLRKAVLAFKVSDGLTPSEKLMDGESLAMAMQTMAAVPQLAAGFNVPQMFSYLMKSRGARLTPFEKSPEQVAYEQALATWQQAAAMMAEALKDMDPAMQQQHMQVLQQASPMPTPEQFGYIPGKPNVSPDNQVIGQKSILTGIGEKVAAIQAPAQTQQGAQNANQQ